MVKSQDDLGGCTASLDPSFGEKVLLTMRERFRRILLSHEEVSGSLCAAEQARLCAGAGGSGIPDAVIICMAKIESLETGYEQFRFSLGDLDSAMLEGRCHPALEAGGAIVKATLREVNAGIGSLDEPTVDRFEDLVAKVSGRLTDVEDFKVQAMILLFSSAGGGGGTETTRKVLDVLKERYVLYCT